MDTFRYDDLLVYRSLYAPVSSNMFTILNGKEAVVFDPNEDEELLSLFKRKGIEKVHILLTHGHYDHISGVQWLKEKTGADVFCHQKCAERLADSKRALARLVAFLLAEEDRKDGGRRYEAFKESYKPFIISADITYEKQTVISIGDLVFEVTSTPGHSEGSSCYKLCHKMVFTGDTLLQDNAAITRFPGGNTEDYKHIALPYLQSLPKDTIIMPGHGDPFILEDSNSI